jgi:hypothetical protein
LVDLAVNGVFTTCAETDGLLLDGGGILRDVELSLLKRSLFSHKSQFTEQIIGFRCALGTQTTGTNYGVALSQLLSQTLGNLTRAV